MKGVFIEVRNGFLQAKAVASKIRSAGCLSRFVGLDQLAQPAAITEGGTNTEKRQWAGHRDDSLSP